MTSPKLPQPLLSPPCSRWPHSPATTPATPLPASISATPTCNNASTQVSAMARSRAVKRPNCNTTKRASSAWKRAHQAYQRGRHDQHHNAGHIGQRHDGSQHFDRTNRHSSVQPVPVTTAAAATGSTASTQRGNNGNHYGQIRHGNNSNNGNNATQPGPSTNSPPPRRAFFCPHQVRWLKLDA